MINKHISIIGTGNMGTSIINGLLSKQIIKANQLHATGRTDEKLLPLQKSGVHIATDNIQAINQSQIVLFAVKPQQLTSVLNEIKHSITPEHLAISIAAGYSMKTIEHILGSQIPIARVMPNLCASIGMSASVWTHTASVKSQQIQDTKTILTAIGSEYYVADESLLDAATAISGSGPAYIFYFVELLSRAAASLGLKEDLANQLVLQTLVGSAALLTRSAQQTTPITARELRARVTSKGGTTEAAIHEFQNAKLDTIIIRAVQAAHTRAQELEK